MKKLLIIVSLFISLTATSQGIEQAIGPAHAITLDSLYTHVGKENQPVLVLGRHSFNDGFGGWYVYKPTRIAPTIPYLDFPLLGREDSAGHWVAIQTMTTSGGDTSVFSNPDFLVLDILTTPPSTPSTGDIYLAGFGSAGDWLNQDWNIEEWTGSTWQNTVPEQGQLLINGANSHMYKYTGTEWIDITTTLVLNDGGNDYGFKDLSAGNWQNKAFWLMTNHIIVGGFDSSGAFYAFNVGDDPSPDSVLTIVNGQVMKAAFPTSVSTATASEGLHAAGSDVRLGGTLTHDTTIDASTHILTVTGSNGSSPLAVTSTSASASSAAIYANSNQGFAGRFLSNNAVPLSAETNIVTNSIQSLLKLYRFTAGTATSGLGGSLDFEIENTTGGLTTVISNSLKSEWTSATAGSETSQFTITGINTGTAATLFTLGGNGRTSLNKYGVGSFTSGTPTYNLGVDASGNIMEVATGGGGSGSTNSNIGSGYRLAVPGTNNIKTLHAGTNITLDSAANANEITINSTGVGSGDSTFNALSMKYPEYYNSLAGDGIHDTTASITSGTATLATVHSVFASGDVGKYIFIAGAGTSGQDFIGTITAYTNATHVTISSNAGTTVSNATIIFGTDATAAIQSAINAAWTTRKPTVFLQNKIYIIAGALNSNCNCQINISAPAQFFNDSITGFQLIGQTPPSFTQYSVFFNRDIQGYNCTMLFSMTSSFTTAGQAIIGTKGVSNGFGTFNFNSLIARNIQFKVARNPAGTGPVMGGLSWKNGADMKWDWLAYSPTGYPNNSVIPVNDVAGFETPDFASNNIYTLTNIFAAGAKKGIVIGEHVSADQLNSAVNYYGLFQKRATHASNVMRYLSIWNANDVYIGPSNGFSTATSIAQMSNEWDTTSTKWWKYQYTFNDSANLNRGTVGYFLVLSGVAINQTGFAVNGGKLTIFKPLFYPYLTQYSNADSAMVVQNLINSTSAATSFKVRNANGLNATLSVKPSSYTAIGGWANNTQLIADSALYLVSNGLLNNNGTQSIYLRAGGYSSTNGLEVKPNGQVKVAALTLLPNTSGLVNQVWSSDGAGNMGWTYPSQWQGTESHNSGNIAFNAGNVSIGVASPSYRLDVQTATNIDGIRVRGTSTTNTSGLVAQNDGSALGWFRVFSSAASLTHLQNNLSITTTNDLVLMPDDGSSTGGTHAIRFFGGGFSSTQERARITKDGMALNTTSVTSGLTVNNSVAFAYIAKAVDYTATATDQTIEVTATGKTITLPTAVSITGRMYTIKLTASGTGTVATTSSQTIDGSTTYSLSAQYKYVTVMSNGANWIIIGNN